MPTADTANPFGRIITSRDVEAAIVILLQKWVPTYIAQVESQAGLPQRTLPMPPDKNLSYRAAPDANQWEQSWSPCYFVRARPANDPERYGDYGAYTTPFEIDVWLNFVVTNQVTNLAPAQGGLLADSARQYADLLGMAACWAILQNGSIGTWPDGTPVSTKTNMTGFPDTIFPRADNRRFAQCHFTLSMIVSNVLYEAGGIDEPLTDPYAEVPDLVNVTSITISQIALSPGGDVSNPQWSVKQDTNFIPGDAVFPGEELYPGVDGETTVSGVIQGGGI